MTSAFSLDVYLSYGRNVIDLIKGQIENQETKEVTLFDPNGAKYHMDKVRKMLLFSDADVTVEFAGAEVEFDMMSFYKEIGGIELEQITIDVTRQFVPDKVLVIIVASDDPAFQFGVQSAKPHLFYGNNLVANNADYQPILYRHTVLDKTKVTVFNNDAAAKDITVDIQHKEIEDDTNDDWVSYDNYPKDLAAGDIESFGDDALLDTRHHFHKISVKAKNVGETSPVKAVMFGV